VYLYNDIVDIEKDKKQVNVPKINFREAQAKNRRRTIFLIVGFILFFALVGAVFGAAFAGGAGDSITDITFNLIRIIYRYSII